MKKITYMVLLIKYPDYGAFEEYMIDLVSWVTIHRPFSHKIIKADKTYACSAQAWRTWAAGVHLKASYDL